MIQYILFSLIFSPLTYYYRKLEVTTTLTQRELEAQVYAFILVEDSLLRERFSRAMLSVRVQTEWREKIVQYIGKRAFQSLVQCFAQRYIVIRNSLNRHRSLLRDGCNVVVDRTRFAIFETKGNCAVINSLYLGGGVENAA